MAFCACSGLPRIVPRAPIHPATKLRLELRAGGWVPQRLLPGSTDPRTLGIQVSRVTMRNASGGARVFNANTGDWIEPAKPKPWSQTR